MLLVLKRQNQLDAILAQGGSVILMSHLRSKVEEKYSLKHILKTTSDVLGKAVVCFRLYCEEAKNAAAKLQAGEVYVGKLILRKRKRDVAFKELLRL
jgi:3-phosphoglycerate kinase